MSEDVRLTTWGVKVTDEVREKLRNMMETSGLPGKDFIESMVSLYEAQMMKDSQPIVAQEISELETLMRRIISMYIGVGDRIKTTLDEKERQYQSRQEQDKETIRLLHGKIRELEDTNKAFEETCVQAQQEAEETRKQKVNLEGEYITKVNSLTQLIESNRALIEEYREKNDMLTGLLGEYRQYKDSLQTVQANAEAREKELRELQNSLAESRKETDALQAAVPALEEKHRADLQQMQDRLTLDNEKHILKLEKDYQGQIQNLRDEYNQQVRNLLIQMQQTQEKKK